MQAKQRLHIFGADLSRVDVTSVQHASTHLQRWNPEDYDLLIIDEAHHSIADSYRKVINHLKFAKIVGFTGTPDRGDGVMLGSIYGKVSYRFSTKRAIAEGFLAPAKSKVVRGEIIPSLLRHCENRQTIVFVERKALGLRVAELLNVVKPGCAQFVSGTTPNRERADMLRAFGNKEFQFMVNVGVLTEGTDIPSTACVAIIRKTGARALKAQMVGRAMRPDPGKSSALVLDFVSDGKLDLGSPTDPLDGKKAFPIGHKLVPGQGLVKNTKQKTAAQKFWSGFWKLMNWRLW